MSTETLVEQRLAHLEREVEELKRRMCHPERHSNWIEQLTGSQREESEFEEVLRLGREIRHQDRPDREA